MFFIKRLLRRFNEREDVTKVKNSTCHTVRVENLEVIEFFTGGGKQDRPASHTGDTQCRTTLGITVEFGQHNAGEINALRESLGRVHRVLTNHRINDEEHLIRGGDLSNLRGLIHHLCINTEATGGVNDHHIVVLIRGIGNTGLRHGDGVANTITRFWGKESHASLFSHDTQLLHSTRALQVTGDQDRCVTLGTQPFGELSGQCRLTGALQTRQHDDRRGLFRETERAGLSTKNRNKFFVDNGNHLLSRIERLVHIVGERALPHFLGEGLDHLECDIGFQ